MEEGPARSALEARIDHAHRAEAAALARMIPPGQGGVAWWGGLPDNAHLTAEALLALGALSDDRDWRHAWDALRRLVQRGALDPRGMALAAHALSRSHERDQRLARRLVSQVRRNAARAGLDELVHGALAARALRSRDDERALATQLENVLRAALDTGAPRFACAGPVWFLCYGRLGTRGAVARAALALRDLRRPRARAFAAEALALTAGAGAYDPFVWGSAEADVLALWAEAGIRSEAPRFEAYVDNRRVPVAAGRVAVPAGARTLVLRFAASPARFARIRARGAVRAAPPTQRMGTAALVRSFVVDSTSASVRVSFRAPVAAENVEIAVPLPAGLSLAPSERGPREGRLSVRDGELRLRFARVSAGEHRYELSLVRTGAGDYEAGEATLASTDEAVWALVPAERVTVR